MINILMTLTTALLLLTGCRNEPKIQPKLKEYWSDKKHINDVVITDSLKKIYVRAKKRVLFPVVEYNKLNRMGFANISGYVEGNLSHKYITLEPITSYSEQWYDETVKKNIELELPDSRFFNYSKLTTSTQNGRFNLHNVPVGKYYLYTKVDGKFLINIIEIQNKNDILEHNLTEDNKPFYLY